MIKVRFDIDSIAGYSAYARDLLQSWHGKNTKFFVDPIVWGDSKLILNKWWDEHVKQFTAPKKYDTVVSIGLPDRHYVREEGKKSVGLTLWEVSSIGSKWVDIMNTMDEIWTGSDFSKRVFIECGVKVPVVVHRWPILEDNYKIIVPTPFSPLQEGAFTFYHQGTFDSRKNFQDLILSYCMEFQDVCLSTKERNTPTKPTLLVLKTYAGFGDKDKRNVELRIRDIKRSMNLPVDPIIAVVQDKVDDDVLVNQIASIDCLVYPSHGEGIGGPLLPAARLNKPTIAPRWSSIPEYAGSKYYEVDYCLEPVFGMSHIIPYRANPLWARINLSSLRHQMRTVYRECCK